MDLLDILLLFVGLALLIIGAEALVRGASRLARTIGIPPLIVGLTVVAFGTSSPEVAVSLQAAFAGTPDLALGNVVGSNIFNVLVVLGLAAAIAPIVVAQQLVRLDAPIMVGVSLVVALLAIDGQLDRSEGAILVAGVVLYVIFLIRQSRRESADVKREYEQEYGVQAEGRRAWLINAALVVVGLGMLVLGSRWLVSGAIAIAQAFGLSELIIGLTIVAAGTSLPEVATSVIAAVRGERDIAAGNVVGSNIFNILLVLGLTCLVAPAGITVAAPALAFDLPVMVATSVAVLPVFFTGHLVARWEGWLFLGYYAAYTAYLILDSANHDALPLVSGAMLLFVLPLTGITLALLVVREYRARKNRGS